MKYVDDYFLYLPFLSDYYTNKIRFTEGDILLVYKVTPAYFTYDLPFNKHAGLRNSTKSIEYHLGEGNLAPIFVRDEIRDYFKIIGHGSIDMIDILYDVDKARLDMVLHEV